MNNILRYRINMLTNSESPLHWAVQDAIARTVQKHLDRPFATIMDAFCVCCRDIRMMNIIRDFQGEPAVPAPSYETIRRRIRRAERCVQRRAAAFGRSRRAPLRSAF